jgi:hypothetical protein
VVVVGGWRGGDCSAEPQRGEENARLQAYSRSGDYQGLSIAILINVALKVKDEIVATGRVSHVRLGEQQVALLVQRGNARVFVPLKVG